MEIFSENVSIQPAFRGYRLIRRDRAPNQKVKVIGFCGGELGFECFAYQSRARSLIAKFKAEGYHVVVVGLRSRHPMYESADEFWGLTAYGEYADFNVPNLMNAAFGSYESRPMTLYDPEVGDSWKIIQSSPKAETAAKNILSKKTIIIMPRYRPEEGNRNFHSWQKIVDLIKEQMDVRILACISKSKAAQLSNVDYIEDLIGLDNILDVEAYIHKNAVCTISGDSGVQCLSILCGVKNLILFCGMFPAHQTLWHDMKAHAGAIGELHIVDETAVMQQNHTAELPLKIANYVINKFGNA
jgi:ADP-heptose:LPS heptosyltransferase